MPIVDAQVHIWAANTPERPWPARHQAHQPEPITKDNLHSDLHRLDRVAERHPGLKLTIDHTISDRSPEQERSS